MHLNPNSGMACAGLCQHKINMFRVIITLIFELGRKHKNEGQRRHAVHNIMMTVTKTLHQEPGLLKDSNAINEDSKSILQQTESGNIIRPDLMMILVSSC